MSSYILTVVVLVWAPTLAGGHCEGTTLVDTYGYALLEESRDLPDVTLRAISIKFCLMRDLDLQIWRKSVGNLFTLEWSLRITPQSLEQDIVHDIPTSDVIRLRPSEHKLGLYVPDRQDLPIFAKWGPGVHQTFYSELDGPFLVNQSYAFMTDLVNPIAFNITLCEDLGCSSDVSRPTRPASTTTKATTLPPLFCNLVNRRTGGRAVLESSRPLPGGILRGVRVRSCLLQPYLLQIWEWAGTAGYTLVWQRWVVPITDDGSMQVVLFSADEYLMSSATYRAGVQLDPYVTLSVPDTPRGPDPMLLQSRDARDFSPCRSANFQPAAFIWDLALDFCTTPDCSASNDIEDYLPYNSPCPTEPPFLVTSPTTTLTSPKPTLVTSPTTMTTSPTTMMTSPTTMMTSPTTMIPTMIVTDRVMTQSSLRPTTSTLQTSTSGMVSERTSDIPIRMTVATTTSQPVQTTQIPNIITTQSSANPTLIIRITSTAMTTPMKATTVTDATSMIPAERAKPSTRKKTTTTKPTTTTTTMRPTTIRTTTKATTTTRATMRKATTLKTTTTTKKVVKPTQSQNNIVKNPNAKAAVASGSNNGRGIHPKVPIGTFIIIGTLNCLLMLPCL